MERLDVRRFVTLSVMNGMIVIMALVLYLVFLNVIFPKLDFTALLWLDSNLVYSIQRLLGIPVELYGTTFNYTMSNGGRFFIELVPECLAVAEMVLFVMMLAVFRGVGRQAKIRGMLIFLPVIFIENIVRLVTLYPLAEILGIHAMWDFHFVWWVFGQFAFLMFLFGAWYLLFARREVTALMTLHGPVRHGRRRPRLAKGRKPLLHHPVRRKERDEHHKRDRADKR